jgi:DHHC palmitoyltransferase
VTTPKPKPKLDTAVPDTALLSGVKAAMRKDRQAKVIAAIEIEYSSENDSIDSFEDHGPRVSKGTVVLRYFALASAAVAATISCPGGTILWVNKAVQWQIAARLCLIASLTLAGFLLVHTSNPGFLTSELLESLNDAAISEVASLVDNGEMNAKEIKLDPLSPPSTGGDVENSLSGTIQNREGNLRRKRCNICRFAPLIRSHHCKKCSRCVATFDHHCELVGNCIGERNRAVFWWFLLLQWNGFLLCCNIVGSSKVGFVTLMQHRAFSWEIVRVIAAKVYLYPLTLIATIMLGMHSFLAIANMTTFECVKGPKHLDYLQGTRDMDLPFSRGVILNLKSYCCGHSWTQRWTPTQWRPPGKIVRDSEDWWNNPWQNKYWSCC